MVLLFTGTVPINAHNSNTVQYNSLLPSWEKTTSKALLFKQIMLWAFQYFALGA